MTEAWYTVGRTATATTPRAARLRPPAAGDHRPLAGGAVSRWPRATGATSCPTTGRSTTTANCASSSRRSGTASARAPTPRWCSTHWSSGARKRCCASTACSPSPLGLANGASCLLARDRYGIKPLVHRRRSARRVALRLGGQGAPGPSSARRQDGLTALRRIPHVPELFTERTLFAGVRLMPAGSFLRIGMGRGTRRPHALLGLRVRRGGRRRRRDYVEELDRLLHAGGVNRQLISDVPVATYLSGGMDSGSITAVASRQLPS